VRGLKKTARATSHSRLGGSVESKTSREMLSASHRFAAAAKVTRLRKRNWSLIHLCLWCTMARLWSSRASAIRTEGETPDE